MFEDAVPRLKIGALKPLSVVDNSAYEFYRIAPPGVMLVMIPVGLGEFSTATPACSSWFIQSRNSFRRR